MFRAENASCVVQTHFPGLAPRFDALDAAADAGNRASVKLDVKKLSLLLGVQTLLWETAVVFVCEGEALVLHVVRRLTACVLCVHVMCVFFF